jgi:hypothetical protein
MSPNRSPLRSLSELGEVLGQDLTNFTLLKEEPILDTRAATRAKIEKMPPSLRPANREALKQWIPALTEYLVKTPPPRGFLRDVRREELAFMALRAIMDQIHFGWDKRKTGARRVASGRSRTPTCSLAWSWAERFATSLSLPVYCESASMLTKPRETRRPLKTGSLGRS